MNEHMKREPPHNLTGLTLIRIVLTITTNRTIGLGEQTTRREATQPTEIGHDPKVARANVRAMAGARQLPLQGMLPGIALRGPQRPGV